MLVVTAIGGVGLAHGSPRQQQVLALYRRDVDSQIAKVGDREYAANSRNGFAPGRRLLLRVHGRPKVSES